MNGLEEGHDGVDYDLSRPRTMMVLLPVNEVLRIFNSAPGKTSDKLRAIQKAFAERNGYVAVAEKTLRAREREAADGGRTSDH